MKMKMLLRRYTMCGVVLLAVAGCGAATKNTTNSVATEDANVAKSFVFTSYVSQVNDDVKHLHPYTYEGFSVFVNGVKQAEGFSDQTGKVEAVLRDVKPTDIVRVKLEGLPEYDFSVCMRSLIPWDSELGMTARMKHLGYIGYSRGKDSPDNEIISAFQGRNGLQVTGIYNLETARVVNQHYEIFMGKGFLVPGGQTGFQTCQKGYSQS